MLDSTLTFLGTGTVVIVVIIVMSSFGRTVSRSIY